MTRTASHLLFLLLLAGGAARGQALKDTIVLRSVDIRATRLSQFSSGTKVQRIDSATMARYRWSDLGELLSDETPIFIKSYGSGSLATTSFRGGGANHTAVLWNGFNIGSPMNGQIDLSLIPVSIANAVSIQYGGSSALWGSGAVGGAIHLDNVPGSGRGLTVDAGVSFGSFGDRRQQARVAIGQGKWISSLTVYNATARNDFDFHNTEERGAPLQQQQHAEFRQQGLLAEDYYRINAKQRINLRFWYENSDREVPPTMVQETSTAEQQDGSYRATAEWQHVGARVKTVARAAWFDERLHWSSSDLDSADRSRSRTAIAEAESIIRLGRGQVVNVGITNTYAQALSDGYAGEPHQDRAAAFASYQSDSRNGRSRTTLSARQELVAGKLAPLTGSLGSGYGLNGWLTAKANVARVYRIPTFNDLFWTPGGDPDLLPESGYSGEAGLAMDHRLGGAKARFIGDVTGYSRTMDNWIIWLPGPSYWSPMNIMNVWSRGVEAHAEVAMPVKQATVKLGVMTNYVLSTNQVAKSVNDASVDKQLIYVPIYSGNGKLSLIYKGVIASFGMNYTGYRYTSTDNSEYIDPYWLANASIAYRLPLRGTTELSVLAQGFNLFDEQYQVMLSRPMPLRNFRFGISLRFNRPLPATPLDPNGHAH
jgi:iron complex outermembrane receptor protein